RLVDGSPVDLGFVGRITAVDADQIFSLLDQGKVPVISPVASNADSTGPRCGPQRWIRLRGVGHSAGSDQNFREKSDQNDLQFSQKIRKKLRKFSFSQKLGNLLRKVGFISFAIFAKNPRNFGNFAKRFPFFENDSAVWATPRSLIQKCGPHRGVNYHTAESLTTPRSH
ncbi:MAG: hypothetical protein AN484_28700, partial [Aphanizomenon flos-aquae WA102]